MGDVVLPTVGITTILPGHKVADRYVKLYKAVSERGTPKTVVFESCDVMNMYEMYVTCNNFFKMKRYVGMADLDNKVNKST